MTLADDLVPALQALADRITTAGVPASLTRARVNPGGAWVDARTADVLTLSGDGEATAHVYLVGAPGQDDLSVLTSLALLLGRVLAAGIVPTEPVDLSYSLALPHTPSSAFPAFRLVVDLDL